MARTPMFTLCLESALLLIAAGVDPKVNVTASLAHPVVLRLIKKRNVKRWLSKSYYLQLI
jgi:hypothetical protein